MRSIQKRSFALLIYALIGVSFNSEAQIIKDSGWIYDSDQNSDGQGDSGKIQTVCKGSSCSCQREITFKTGKMKKVLSYNCCFDKSHLKNGQQIHTLSMAGLGMGDVAWHINGFIDIVSDGSSIAGRIPEIKTEENEDHGIAQYIWPLPNGKVEVSFRAEYGDDLFSVQVKFQDINLLHKREIMFICYPSTLAMGVAGAYRDRYCITPKRSLQHWNDKLWKELSAEEFWLVYCDKYWDLGIEKNKGKCDGPCALLYIPSEYQTAEIKVSNYEIYTHFICGDKNEFNFLLWPSVGIANAEFIDKMNLIRINASNTQK